MTVLGFKLGLAIVQGKFLKSGTMSLALLGLLRLITPGSAQGFLLTVLGSLLVVRR